MFFYCFIHYLDMFASLGKPSESTFNSPNRSNNLSQGSMNCVCNVVFHLLIIEVIVSTNKIYFAATRGGITHLFTIFSKKDGNFFPRF